MPGRSFGGLHYDDIQALLDEGREKGYGVRYELSEDNYHYTVYWTE